MEIKASTLIMSHLSDAQDCLSMMDDHKFASSISEKINFAKFVLTLCRGDVDQLIDADQIYQEYEKI